MEHCQLSIKCKIWCRKWNEVLVRGDITVTAGPGTQVAF